MLSTSGFSINPKNCLAYEDKLSTYLLCPSAYKVSKAKLDFPDPESPVITTSLSLGISKFIFFKLCSLAPLITILSLFIILKPPKYCHGSGFIWQFIAKVPGLFQYFVFIIQYSF